MTFAERFGKIVRQLEMEISKMKVTANSIFANPKGWMTPPKPIKSARMMAKKLGATYQYDGINVRVEAPPFHVWKEGGVHELVCTDNDDAISRMSVGMERCPNVADCDWCNDTKTLRIVK